jgi:hypothetical protein
MELELEHGLSGIELMISVIVIVIGWVFSRYKDREQEKFSARLERREQLVSAMLQYRQIIYECKGDFTHRRAEYTKCGLTLMGLMDMYGLPEEKKLLQNYVDQFLGESKVRDGTREDLEELYDALISSVRSDLGFIDKKSRSSSSRSLK